MALIACCGRVCLWMAPMFLFLSLSIGIATARTERNDYEKTRRAALQEFIQGHFGEAEALYLKAFHEAETNHDEYAVALNLSGLGDVFHTQGRHVEAEAAYRRSLSIFRKTPDSELVLAIALHNLGSCYIAQQRYSESLSILQEASQIAEKVPTPHEQLTGEIQNSIGVVYFYQGKMRKAESMFYAAIRTYAGKRAWAADIAHAINNLAQLHQSKRQLVKAEELFRTSIKLTEQSLGVVHPGLTTILENLGELYIDLQRYEEAGDQFQRSIAILEQSKPLLNFRLVHSLHGLSKIFRRRGDKAQAEAALARAAEIIGPKPTWNPEVLHILESYAGLLKEAGKSVEAREIQYRAKRMVASLAWTVRVQDLK